MPKDFLYRGHTLDSLLSMSMDEFINLLPSRQRRSLQRGLTPEQRILLEKLREAREAVETGKDVSIKTHVRDLIILPEVVGMKILIHNGKEFIRFKIIPQMIGHVFGEFSSPMRQVKHGSPGIGATKSSQYVPLK